MNPPDRLTDWTQGEERLVISTCTACAHSWYLPRDACPSCGDSNVEGNPATGSGVVAAAATVHRHASPESPDSGPIGIVLVDLDEGVRVMGRAVLGITVGAAVRVNFIRVEPAFGGSPTLLPEFEAVRS